MLMLHEEIIAEKEFKPEIKRHHLEDEGEYESLIIDMFLAALSKGARECLQNQMDEIFGKLDGGIYALADQYFAIHDAFTR